MNVTAALCWYDEPVEALERCVASLEGVCDRLVAVDGRWDVFPGARDLSPLEQKLAIQAAARAAGIKDEVHGGGPFAWESQVAKRSYAIERAASTGDWVLVIDADEHISSSDRAALHALLAATDLDVGEVPLTNRSQRWPLNQLHTHTFAARRLFRSACAPHYERAHNGVRASDGRWLSGSRRHVALEPTFVTADLNALALALRHDLDARSGERQQARRIYYKTRRRNGLEAWA